MRAQGAFMPPMAYAQRLLQWEGETYNRRYMKKVLFVQIGIGAEKYRRDAWDDIARTLMAKEACGGGVLEVKVQEVGSIEPAVLTKERTEYGKAIRKDYDKGRVKEKRANMTKWEPRKDGISNTLTSVQKDNMLCEPIALDEQNECLRMDGTVGTLTTDGSSPKHNNRVVEPFVRGSLQEHASERSDGICPTLTEAMGMGGGQVPVHNYGYRIRKLTPRECWRLMAFSDEDFDKAREVNSDAQLYKQAGNAIVCTVLEEIFKKIV